MDNISTKKLIMIGVGIVVVFSTIVILVLRFLVFGTHQKTTSFSDYKAPAVSLNCSYNYDNNGINTTVYSDFVYNYQKSYKVAIYNRIVMKYQNGISDDEYNNIINSLNSLDCNNDNSDVCTSKGLNLDSSKFGWLSKIDEENNTITINFYNLYDKGKKANKNDKETIKKFYQANGYICE